MTTELIECKQKLIAMATRLEYLERQFVEVQEANRLLQEQLEARHVNP